VPPDDWQLERRAETWVVTAGVLGRAAAVGHAFSTRREGAAARDFDLGPARQATVRQRDRRRALCHAVGLGEREPFVLEQEHGARTVAAPQGPASGDAVVGDALYATVARRAPPILSVRTADCAPLLVAAEDGAVVAAIHAGWRGAAAGVVATTLAALAREGVQSWRLLVAIGPTIGPCCYEVGPEVARAVAERTRVPEVQICSRPRAGRLALDLPRALGLQLLAAGVEASNVSVAPWCTACRSDLFFSYRRDGAAAGRMMAVVGWQGGVP